MHAAFRRAVRREEKRRDKRDGSIQRRADVPNGERVVVLVATFTLTNEKTTRRTRLENTFCCSSRHGVVIPTETMSTNVLSKSRSETYKKRSMGIVVSRSTGTGTRFRVLVLFVSLEQSDSLNGSLCTVVILPPALMLCLSSGEHVLCRQVPIVGDTSGNGGVHSCLASSVLGIFCSEPPLRLDADGGGDERLLIRDVCNVSHGRS